MPKRFIDTEFFKKPLVRGMEAPYKLLYLFIICDCDVAGIWNPDFEIASIYLGIKVDRKKFMQLYENKYIELENGQFFIPGFIRHQYSAGLCTTNPAHKKIIEKLTALNLIDSTLNPEGAWKGLVSRSQATKVKEKVKEEEEVKVKEMDKKKEEEKEKEEKAEIQKIHPLQTFVSNLPNVSKLKPLTLSEAEKLTAAYPMDLIFDKLAGMENKKNLSTQYISCYLTLNNWCKRSNGQQLSDARIQLMKDMHELQSPELQEAINQLLPPI